jgi:hypothetical protein
MRRTMCIEISQIKKATRVNNRKTTEEYQNTGAPLAELIDMKNRLNPQP